MNSKNNKKTSKAGLGRSLAELLSDNDEHSNLENKVLMHKEDGTTVKIYNKPEPVSQKKPVSGTSRQARTDSIRSAEDRSTAIRVGKTRAEQLEEAKGKPIHGKPHVVNGGEVIRITPNTRRSEDDQPRIIIENSPKNNQTTTAEGLDQLDRYRPTVKDSFLEELLELSESTPSKVYETDSEGRIIIEAANKSRVKKRK